MPNNKQYASFKESDLHYSNVLGVENLPAKVKDQLKIVLRKNKFKKISSNPTEKQKKVREAFPLMGKRRKNTLDERLEKAREKEHTRKELLRVAEKATPKLTRGWLQAKIAYYLTLSPQGLQKEFSSPSSTAIDMWIIRIITEGINQVSLSKLEFLLENLLGKIPANLTIAPKENSSWSTVVSEISNVEFKAVEGSSEQSPLIHSKGSERPTGS